MIPRCIPLVYNNSLVPDINFWLVGFDSWLRVNKLTLNGGTTFGMVISNREILSNPHIAFRDENVKLIHLWVY